MGGYLQDAAGSTVPTVPEDDVPTYEEPRSPPPSDEHKEDPNPYDNDDEFSRAASKPSDGSGPLAEDGHYEEPLDDHEMSIDQEGEHGKMRASIKMGSFHPDEAEMPTSAYVNVLNLGGNLPPDPADDTSVTLRRGPQVSAQQSGTDGEARAASDSPRPTPRPRINNGASPISPHRTSPGPQQRKAISAYCPEDDSDPSDDETPRAHTVSGYEVCTAATPTLISACLSVCVSICLYASAFLCLDVRLPTYELCSSHH